MSDSIPPEVARAIARKLEQLVGGDSKTAKKARSFPMPEAQFDTLRGFVEDSKNKLPKIGDFVRRNIVGMTRYTKPATGQMAIVVSSFSPVPEYSKGGEACMVNGEIAVLSSMLAKGRLTLYTVDLRHYETVTPAGEDLTALLNDTHAEGEPINVEFLGVDMADDEEEE